MKYKVKNITSGEEVLCEKVVVDNQDYYYSKDIHISKGVMIYNSSFNSIVESANDTLVNCKLLNGNFCAKVIATTNKSLDLPMVVDEVEELASKSADSEECFNNVDGDFSGYYDYIEGYKIGYNQAKETYSFTKEDMVEFTEWCEKIYYYSEVYKMWCTEFRVSEGTLLKTSELFDIWQEQRTKTILVK